MNTISPWSMPRPPKSLPARKQGGVLNNELFAKFPSKGKVTFGSGLIYFTYFFPFLLFSFLLLSCEKENEKLLIEESNPFKDRVEFNGLILEDKIFETPSAFIEIWGSNDSLSSDFDGYLTDGVYDKLINSPKIKDYSILVHFDFNSPSLTKLAPGSYTFENTNERKPGIFNSTSHIRIVVNNRTETYKITAGTAHVEEKNGYILFNYELTLNNEISITGQYTGKIDLRLPH